MIYGVWGCIAVWYFFADVLERVWSQNGALKHRNFRKIQKQKFEK